LGLGYDLERCCLADCFAWVLTKLDREIENLLEQNTTVEYRGNQLLCLDINYVCSQHCCFQVHLHLHPLLFGLQNLHAASIFCRGFSIQEARIIRYGAVPLSSRYRCRYRKSKFLQGHTIWTSVVRWRRRPLVDRVAESCSMLHLTTGFSQITLHHLHLQQRALHGRTIHPMIPISQNLSLSFPSRS
jgi:hypothetical protein